MAKQTYKSPEVILLRNSNTRNGSVSKSIEDKFEKQTYKDESPSVWEEKKRKAKN